ncbi:kinesin-like protein [Kipferlia bialata]|uniref:Kinesin-like protein n=1 Tax=Kipferlia bialata TaxID=797122 RepID=A0A391NPY4_9EUKA|nr:kinesin-like protein [Kipferlia bialata]|eukprot:g6847.t1
MPLARNAGVRSEVTLDVRRRGSDGQRFESPGAGHMPSVPTLALPNAMNSSGLLPPAGSPLMRGMGQEEDSTPRSDVETSSSFLADRGMESDPDPQDEEDDRPLVSVIVPPVPAEDGMEAYVHDTYAPEPSGHVTEYVPVDLAADTVATLADRLVNDHQSRQHALLRLERGHSALQVHTQQVMLSALDDMKRRADDRHAKAKAKIAKARLALKAAASERQTLTGRIATLESDIEQLVAEHAAAQAAQEKERERERAEAARLEAERMERERVEAERLTVEQQKRDAERAREDASRQERHAETQAKLGAEVHSLKESVSVAERERRRAEAARISAQTALRRYQMQVAERLSKASQQQAPSAPKAGTGDSKPTSPTDPSPQVSDTPVPDPEHDPVRLSLEAGLREAEQAERKAAESVDTLKDRHQSTVEELERQAAAPPVARPKTPERADECVVPAVPSGDVVSVSEVEEREKEIARLGQMLDEANSTISNLIEQQKERQREREAEVLRRRESPDTEAGSATGSAGTSVPPLTQPVPPLLAPRPSVVSPRAVSHSLTAAVPSPAPVAPKETPIPTVCTGVQTSRPASPVATVSVREAPVKVPAKEDGADAAAEGLMVRVAVAEEERERLKAELHRARRELEKERQRLKDMEREREERARQKRSEADRDAGDDDIPLSRPLRLSPATLRANARVLPAVPLPLPDTEDKTPASKESDAMGEGGDGSEAQEGETGQDKGEAGEEDRPFRLSLTPRPPVAPHPPTHSHTPRSGRPLSAAGEGGSSGVPSNAASPVPISRPVSGEGTLALDPRIDALKAQLDTLRRDLSGAEARAEKAEREAEVAREQMAENEAEREKEREQEREREEAREAERQAEAKKQTDSPRGGIRGSPPGKKGMRSVLDQPRNARSPGSTRQALKPNRGTPTTRSKGVDPGARERERELRQLRSDLAKAQEAVARGQTAMTKLKTVEQEVATLKKAARSAQHQRQPADTGRVKELERDVAEAVRQGKSASQAQAAAERKLKAAEASLAKAQAEVEKQTGLVAAAKRQAQDLKGQSGEARQTQAALERRLADAEKKLGKEAAARADETKALSAQLAKAKDASAALQAQASEAQAQVAKLQSEKRELTARVGNLGDVVSELQAVKASVKELERKEVKHAERYADLETSYKREQVLRKRYFNMIEDMKGKIRVFVRTRPMSGSEIDRGSVNVVTIPDEYTASIDSGKHGTKNFIFDHIFGPTSTQEDVFENVQHIIQSAMDGYNACIFAYGQTGSGKTFTMIGADNKGIQAADDDPNMLNIGPLSGIAPRAINQLYSNIKVGG